MKMVFCRITWLASVALFAQTGAPPTMFPTPEAAVAALVRAVQSDQTDRVATILGVEMRDALKSDNSNIAKIEKDLFLAAAKRRVKIERGPNNQSRAIAYFGEQEWPFPAPLVREGQSWHFDGKEGIEEARDRRLGRDELGAIEVCRTYVVAQLEYSSHDHNDDGMLEFSQKAFSSAGRQDGLYWPNDQGQDLSPLGPLFAHATDGAENPEPLAGYHYKILTRQGAAAKGGARDYILNGHMVLGFALVAWPAEYGKSGISTFIVNQLGDVYEKDLGNGTAAAAKSMSEFNPDSSWKKVTDD